MALAVTTPSISQYLVVSRELTALQQNGKEFQQSLKVYSEGTRAQPGCVQYVLTALQYVMSQCSSVSACTQCHGPHL